MAMEPQVDAVTEGEATEGQKEQQQQQVDLSVKHPLEDSWTLWFDNPKLKKPEESWEDTLKNIMSFSTVEDFWCLYGNILPASRIPSGSNYSVFKHGIKPMWEDPQNAKGGKWVLTVGRGERKHMDDWWLHSLLAVIGGTLELEGHEEICGLVVSARKSQDRISLWTRTAETPELVHQIGTRLRQALNLPDRFQLKYQTHDDALNTGSSFKNKALYQA
eukprot:TRINITY_DN8623_c0_g1_i1.p2 TRINITY_DN8623_c0_g1~~TRINITY_DN8623_c0_g1_i1.p2  ORF type:complete len:218 (-),score=70.40 TRINITY_DN8623_c0_g1_i1:425-1078(-)